MALKRVLLLLATISLGLPGLVVGQITPANVLMGSFQQQRFQLPGYSQVTWEILPAQGLGTIDQNGLYTSPNLAGFQSTQVAFVYAAVANGPSFMTVVYLIPGHGQSSPPPAPVTTLTQIAPLNITISLSPGSVSLQEGKSVTFTPTVQGTNNHLVQWSMSPSIGILTTNGVYTAPSSITSDTQVTISATSEADSTKVASSTIMLTPPVVTSPPPPPPVTVSLSPETLKLNGGQTATFTPTITGTSNTGLIWAINPPVGTLTNGVYRAPATITAKQIVTVRATSVVNAAATWTSKVTLLPASILASSTPLPPGVSITLSPTASSLTGGQKVTLTPTVTGSSNIGVTWSLAPQVGTLANGVYNAPAIIATQQTVTVTATSAADSTKSASSTIKLTPIAVTLGPASVTVAAGKTATFTASLTGSSNTAVTWALTPAVGTINKGVYTAPSTVASAQKVTITAASVVDPSKTATATVSLTTSSPQNTTILLPLEVMGADGTTSSANVNVPSGGNLNGPLTLWMQVHGLKYETEASVQVNSSAWMPLSTGHVKLLGNAAAFGGIGGGFHTLEMTLNLPPRTVVAGTNTVTFRFNGTDGVVSGFRVLAFNIQSSGTNLIPASQFVNDDPSTWQGPSTAASDIAAGKTLWQSASLTTPAGPIQAHCSDCHAQDGRDLKYFNYSNNSIQVRSVFHGLTAQQGNQIASYIRSLNLPNPGRPWNPPYQPGPGLDSEPVSNWAAGAGIEAVLDNDAEMQQYLTPGGSTAGWSANAYLNQRELPIFLQLPDWNSWLPVIHPMDAYGATFTNSNYNKDLAVLRSTLQPNSPTAYKYAVVQGLFDLWFEAETRFMIPVMSPPVRTASTSTDVYAAALWMQVKMWELNQEFGLEGMPQVPFGAKADVRGWLGSTAFDMSPNMLHIPAGPGIGNGTQVARDYLSLIWYQTQLILNDGQGSQTAHNPIDYAYVFGFVKDLLATDANVPGIMLQLEWNIKSLQEFTLSGIGPQAGNGQENAGWHPLDTSALDLVGGAWYELWSATSPAARATLLEAYMKAWFAQASQYTPQQWYQGGWATPTQNPAQINSASTFGGQVWYILPRLRYLGVDTSLTDQISAWAATIWPNGNWILNNTGTCSSVNHCSTD